MEELNNPTEATASVTGHKGEDGAIVVAISGELDMSSVPSVRAELDPLVANQESAITFDLADLKFMDSSGIALLIQIADRCGHANLRNTPALIRRIIEATGVSEILRVEQ